MPADYQLVEDGVGAVIKAWGVLNGSELIRLKLDFAKRYADRGMLRYWLVDLTDVESIEISTGEIRKLVDIDKRLSELLPESSVAIAAPSDEAFGISRMWQLMADEVDWPKGVFRSFDEAERWTNEHLAKHPPNGNSAGGSSLS